jgi:hypothetical protein
MPTFMLRRRVITPTTSTDSGTGDPMPISFPVSRGSGCNEDGVEVPVVGGVESAVLVPSRWAGTTGGARSSDGAVSILPFPRFGP